jgi:H+/Cl- antiporter ClcA
MHARVHAERAPRPVGDTNRLTLLALFAPGVLFAVGLYLARDLPRYRWLRDPSRYPWELWMVAVCGIVATLAGVGDWCFHRAGGRIVSATESKYELLALAGGGFPLFVLMAFASVATIVVGLFTAVVICFDQLLFHRRCSAYERRLHYALIFGNAAAWLAWCHWCYVREPFFV